MNTHETPQPHTNSPGEDTRAAQVRYAVLNTQGYNAVESLVELVLTHAPELRAWAADTLTQRGYRTAAARLRVAPASFVERVTAAQNAARATNSPVVATADTGAPVLIPLDVELARLMVALNMPLAVVLTYWAARAHVSANERAGGRIRLADLTPVLHRIGLYPAARTLDTWLDRGETAGLWRVHGRGKRRAIYIRGHRRLCAHFTARAAKERPAAVATNLPGKLWAVLEFDGSKLTAAAMLGKLWAAWYFTRDRTHRISHATQRDLWNRTRFQLNAARAAAGVTPGRPGRVFHPHELAPARAFPAVFEHERGVVVIAMTHAANAYTTRAAIHTHRRARRSNHAAYATAADVLSAHTQTNAPAIEGATGQPGRVPESRVYYERASTVDNFKSARRAIARQRTDTARARVQERSLTAYGASADYFEQLVVTADGGEPIRLVPTPYRENGRWHGGRLSQAKEGAHLALTGGVERWQADYAAPHGESVPRRRKGGVCA